MNAIERRVSEGLRAYGEGLIMTTQDIDRIERELETRRPASPSPRRVRFWQGAVAACAVTGLVLGAFALRDDSEASTQPAGPPPITLAQLEGIWRVADSDWLWRFGADGTVTLSNTPNLLTGVGTTPAFTVRPTPGGFLAENDPGEPEGCSMVWDATISPEGRMRARETGQRVGCTVALEPPARCGSSFGCPRPQSRELQPCPTGRRRSRGR